MKIIKTLIFILLSTAVMAKEIKTEIVIHAKPDKIWEILLNFENYPKWNPFIKSIKGNAKVGGKLSMLIAPPDAKEMTFKPKILTCVTNKELSWLGRLLFPGIFDGTHKFQLVDNANGTTTFIQSEKFRGILVPLFKNLLDNNTKRGFEDMNRKLKELAEEK